VNSLYLPQALALRLPPRRETGVVEFNSTTLIMKQDLVLAHSVATRTRTAERITRSRQEEARNFQAKDAAARDS
jgi:hypothetical protein